MTSLSKNILATIAYYDVFDYPLTAFEIWKYLIAYGDSDSKEKGFSLVEIMKELEGDELKDKIAEYRGFYFQPDRKDLVEKRIARNKISEEKFRIIRRVAWLLRFVPFVRLIAVTGGVAMKNASGESDLDLLVALKYKHIFTGRTLVTCLVHLLGKRRYAKKIADRICLNYFVTDKSLEIQLKDLFSSSEYSFIFPIFGGSTFQKFQINNDWIRSKRPNFILDSLENLKMIPDSDLARFFRRWGERFLSFNVVEKKLKKWETKKIANNPKTKKSGSMIVADDDSLVFLPNPHGPGVFEKFKDNLKKISLD